MTDRKKRFGDRRDGRLVRDVDAMHFIVPIIYPGRCDNEAYISERIDITRLNEYIKAKNEGETEFPYTLFHLITTALVKTITLRPKLNRFIANKNLYQRDEVSAAFVIKKQFTDHAEEGLAFLRTTPQDTLEDIHDDIKRQVISCRSDVNDRTSDSMDILNRLPRPLSKFLISIIMFLDRHGWCPQFLVATDPYYSSVVISNLGSIKLKCGYHHLTNWGTCSLFCVIGEKKLRPVFMDDGSYEMRETLDIGLTVDERIADGYYYSKSVKLLKHFLENPDLLERPMNEEVNHDERIYS